MGSSVGANLASAMGYESVIIFVGPEKKRYMLHKNLLTRNSTYFDRALNGNFKEAEEQSIHLPEESPGAFDLLVTFLYQDRVPVVRCYEGSFAATAQKSKQPPLPSSATVPIFRFGGTTPDVSQPENNGTGSIAHRPYEETDPVTAFGGLSAASRFHSICAQQEYRKLSPEELRMADYKQGRSERVFRFPNVYPHGPSVLPFGHSDVSTQAPAIEGSPVTPQTPSKSVSTIPTPFPQATGHIPGIPRCQSLSEIAAADEAHQLSILQLCLLAETLCWPDLFNRAMTAYVQGESNFFNRILRHDHIELVHQRAHEESPFRAYIADAFVAQLASNSEAASYTKYMDVINEYPGFLEDIFKSMSKNPAVDMRTPKTLHKCEYHDHSDGKSCVRDPVFPGGHMQNSFGVPFGGYASASSSSGFPGTHREGDIVRTQWPRESGMMDWRTAPAVLPPDESD